MDVFFPLLTLQNICKWLNLFQYHQITFFEHFVKILYAQSKREKNARWLPALFIRACIYLCMRHLCDWVRQKKKFTFKSSQSNKSGSLFSLILLSSECKSGVHMETQPISHDIQQSQRNVCCFRNKRKKKR